MFPPPPPAAEDNALQPSQETQQPQLQQQEQQEQRTQRAPGQMHAKEQATNLAGRKRQSDQPPSPSHFPIKRNTAVERVAAR